MMAAVALLALVFAACRGSVGPDLDTLAGWQARPLAPDAQLAQHASQQEACRSGQLDGVLVRVLLQDRRTESTAAFLVAGPGFTGSCLVSLQGGNAGGGSTDVAPAPLMGAIVVDEQSSGTVGAGTGSLIGGRIAANLAAVRIELSSGLAVEASIGGGHWLAWWPGDATALRITALDAGGSAVATLDDPTTWGQPR